VVLTQFIFIDAEHSLHSAPSDLNAAFGGECRKCQLCL